MEAQQIVNDLHQRLEALGQKPDEQRVREIVSEANAPILAELQAQGKRRSTYSGDTRAAAVAGTKYARHDLTADDVEFMHDILEQAKENRVGSGPSQQLRNLHGDINTRAMDTAEAGYGDELIGVQYVADLWDAARKQSVVFNQIQSFEMNAPQSYIPVPAAPPELMFVAENTAYNSSAYSTTKTGSNRVLVTAYKFVMHQMWSGEMEEDSIIPYIPFLRAQAAYSLGYYSDSVVLNGDTTNAGTGNINLDDADPTDTNHYLSMDGLRHACLVDNTGNATSQGAAPTLDALQNMRKLLLDRTYHMDWGHPMDPNDLLYVTGPETADAIALLDEVRTMDKYGPAATNMTGQVTRIGQHPLLSTIAMSLTEADGKVSTTAGNNTKGAVLAFNKRAYVVGWRRRLKIETERIPAQDQSRIVYSLRMGLGRFSPTGAASGIESAALLYNITV